jgi:hypothetical protein
VGVGLLFLTVFLIVSALLGSWLVLGGIVCSEKASNRHVLQQTAKMARYWQSYCLVLVKFQHAGKFIFAA